MAEIVVGLVGPAIELAKCIVAPIKRQFNYLCCFSSNIRNLRDEAKKLDDGREGLQGRVTIDENNAQVIVPQVKSWLEKANSEIEVNMVEIESEIRNIQIDCFAIKSRFSLSRRAKKTSAYMKELRDNCNIDPISHPPPPASTVPTLVRPTYELESRKRIEDNIMITLRDNKVNIMGIYGMGGVGKTTMAQKIINRSKNERLFDESIMATVSQQVDKLGIQRELAENLGMKLEDESLSSRANILHRRLTGGKRILIVLDDVWKRLNLEELGIPCDESGSKDCTILLTSRDRDVLGEMEAKSIGEIQTLSQEEAWSLFQEKVGACAADQNLQSIAQEIANECKGLPVALVNVAGALKDQKDKSIWEDALEQLKSSNPIDLPSILSEVYRPLKLSYDFLDSPHAGSIFLLCCLFPEDYDIPLKYLTVYAMGLNMFEGIMNLKQARNRTKRLISTLKSRSLLLEGSSENHVRMHDVVRDVAIFIASEERRIHEGNDCTWICPFLGERFKLSMGSIFPNLQLLLIEKPADEKLQIDDSFFEGMRELNVLSIAYYSFISLPQTTQLLKNLRTLHLHECESLETISVVGELENLEILICHYCHSIKELPIEMGRLRRLRLLEISDCSRLKKIAPGVISNLDKLEELKIVDSFVKWEAGDKNNEGKGRKNAGLRELERLSSLTCLEIQIEDSTLAAENISLPPNIVKFDIQFGKTRYIRQGFDKILALDLPREISTGDWINMQLLRKTECLISIGSGSENLDLAEAENIRSLTLDDCQTMTKLVNTTSSLGATTVFPRLESLRLFDLPQLQDLCNINRADVISNLSSIVVCDCHSLRNLFSLTTAKDCLSQLKSLTIRTCDMMEQVLLWNENQKVDIVESGSRRRHITFPKLKTLWLWELPNLTTFCQGIESIEFPLLLVLEIRGCSKLKSLVSTVSSTESGNDQNNSGGIGHHDDCLHWFCEPQKVTFGSLKELNIREDNNISRLWCQQIPFNFFTGLEMLYLYQCGNITSLFSFSVATKLVNLKKVEILDCGKMVRVIEDDKEKDSCQSTVSLFPNLKILRLVWLLELKSFCEWRCALKFSSLEILEINGCPQMERFSLVSLITPCLKEISINEGRYIEEDRRQIMSCLEQVLLLLNEEENENAIGQSRGGGRIAAFPGLEKLKLCDLPNLTTFCKGIFESIKFPMLTEMEIKRCPNLKNLVSTTSSSSGGVNHGDDGDDGDFLHLFCEPKGAFGRLKKLLIEGYINTLRLWCCQIPIHFFMGLERLSISDCGNIRSLFSSSIAGNLHNLRHLVVYGCGEMVKVIEDDKGNDAACGGQTTISLFPKMQRLNLQLLSKLEIFCEWRSSCALVLPSLKTVKIVDCPKMRRFSLGSLTTPNLNKIYTDNKCILETEDLNVVLQQNFIRAKEEEEEKEEEEQEENDHHQERRCKIIEEEEN